MQHIELSYIYGGIVQYQAGEKLGRRKLTDFEFVLIFEGNPTYICNGLRHRLSPGSIVCGKPGSLEDYEWDKKSITRHSFFHFNIPDLPEDWPPVSEWPIVINEPGTVLKSLIQQILNEVLSHTTKTIEKPGISIIRQVEALIDIYVNSMRSRRELITRNEYPKPVQRAIKLMRESIDNPNPFTIDLAKLSETSYVSEKHLCRLFQKNIGLSPIQTFRYMQLQFSIVLLSRSALSISAIARRCGFVDPLYFSRYFSKTYGQSPSQLRASMKAGNPPPVSLLPSNITPIRFYL